MELRQAMHVLGGSASEIASTLYYSNIRGTQWTSCRCPLANYLRQCGFDNPNVGLTGVNIDLPDGRTVTHPMPQPVLEFVLGFDDGFYPYLLEQVA